MGGPVRVRRDGYLVALEPADGRLGLRLAEGPELTVPAPPTGPGTPLLARGRVRGAGGPAERIELQAAAAGARAAVRTVVEIPEDGRGVVVERSPEPRGLAPGAWDAALPSVEVPAGAGLEARPFALGDARDVLVELGPPGGPARVLLGLLGGPRDALLRVVRREDGALRVPVVAAAPEPGRAHPPRLWIGVGRGAPALRADWAARAGVELGAHAPTRGAVAWPGARPSPMLPGLEPVPLRAPGPRPDASTPEAPAWRRAEAGAWRLLVGRVDAVRVADPVRHAFASRRLWLNAVGPLDVARLEGPALAGALALAGLAAGLVELRDPPESLDPERLTLLRRMLPPLAREAFAVDAETLAVPLLGGRLAVLRRNRGPAVRALGLELATVGLHGPHHGFDFFGARDLGPCAGALAPVPVPPGGCRLLALTPAADRPQVTGSTVHVGMGTLEVAALREDGAGGLRLVLRHPGVHEGVVDVAVPGEPRARRVAVAFRDRAEVAVPPPSEAAPAAGRARPPA